MNFQTMAKQRKFILICAAIGVISVFLPWFSYSTGSIFGNASFGVSVNGFRGVGILTFLGFLGAAIVSLAGDQTKPLDKTMWLVALGAGAIALLFTLIRLLDFTGNGAGFSFIGFGMWIAIVAGIATVGSAWMYRSPGDSLKEGFDSLKKNLSSATSQPNSANSNTGTSKVAELEKLIELKNQGKITEEEYQTMKSKIM